MKYRCILLFGAPGAGKGTQGKIKTYEAETKPVLKYYGRKLVHQINVDQSPTKVLADILRFAVQK